MVMSQHEPDIAAVPQPAGGRRLLAFLLAAAIVGGFAVAAYAAASFFQVAATGIAPAVVTSS
jgi:hypothetical protein